VHALIPARLAYPREGSPAHPFPGTGSRLDHSVQRNIHILVRPSRAVVGLPSQRKQALVAEILVQSVVIGDAHVLVADVERHAAHLVLKERVLIGCERVESLIVVTFVTAAQIDAWIQSVYFSIVVLVIAITLCNILYNCYTFYLYYKNILSLSFAAQVVRGNLLLEGFTEHLRIKCRYVYNI